MHRELSAPGTAGLLRICLLATIAWLVVFAVASPAISEPLKRGELLEHVWKIAGLNDLGKKIASNIVSGVQQNPELQKLTDTDRNRVVREYRRFATAQRFSNRLRQHLSQVSNTELNALIAMTKSDVARRAVTAELAFKPLPVDQLKRWWAGQSQRPMAGERQALIDRLDKALGVTDIAVAVAGASLYATRSLVNGPDKEPPSNEELTASIEKFSATVKPWQRAQTQLTYLYLYRELALVELRLYVRLLERDSLRKTQRQLIQALANEMLALQADVVNAILADRNPLPAYNI